MSEGGLDKRTNLDSLQHALFFHYLTGKKPIIVIYDMDGCEGKIELSYPSGTFTNAGGISHEYSALMADAPSIELKYGFLKI